MSVQGVARASIDQEAYLLDTRKVGVQRADDRIDRQRLGLDARWMMVGEAAVQVYHRKLSARTVSGGCGSGCGFGRAPGTWYRQMQRQIKQEDVVDCRTALNRVGRAFVGVLRYEPGEQRMGACSGFG